MKVIIAGGSGFIGEAVVRQLLDQGHAVSVLTRDPARVKAGRPLPWDPKSPGAWTAEVAAADAVVNLAGENIGDGRWTRARKQRLLASRVDATRALVGAMQTAPGGKRAFISASAVGFYGPHGDEELDESALRGAGFLADLASQWEAEARAADPIARLVILRLGVVIGAGGGALAKMLVPFKLGVGGRIGSGEQWMSWISRDDVVRLIEWAISHDEVRGVLNATAPHPVRNRDFTRTLGRALHRPAILPIPGPALRLLFGQMADETLLTGQRVMPDAAVKKGFRFSQDTIESALQRALALG